jgi:polysaccharide deacetylase family protein (PEP-CTERM system associated)
MTRRSLAAMSIDVEDYFQVESLRSVCPRDRWAECEDRTEGSTDRVLDLLDAHEARATFFVLGWTAERHPDLVRRIASRGHEIASHGYAHELVTRETPDTFRADVHRARKILQDLSGQPVLGYRAPSYTIVSRTQWALPILAEEGHTYDSSIFPIKRLRYGMPGAPRWPHRLDLASGPLLVEYPLPTVRFGFFNVPATGGAYLRLFPMSFQAWAIRRMIRNEQAFVINVHPWELDPEQPRLPVGPRTRWTHYHNLHRSQARLSTLLSLTNYRPQLDVLQDIGLLTHSIDGKFSSLSSKSR